MVIASCTKDDDNVNQQIDDTEEPVDPEEPLDTIKFLALGDSYTIGQGVDESERWPVQLSNKLEDNNLEVEKLQIIAQTGWQTDDLLNAIDEENPQGFNLVSLLIGVNNQFSNQEFTSFISGFNLLIEQSKNITGSYDRVFVVSIPDYSVTPFGNSQSNTEQIALEIDMYNDYMAERCAELNIPYINITEISRTLGASENALAPDNLHPSGFQYSLWVEEILPVVVDIVSN